MSGFESVLPRVEAPYLADERTTLLAWLAYHRSTLAMKCDGLTDEQFKARPIPSSTMTMLGLLRHATDVERYWIREILLGHENVHHYYSDASPDGDFDDLDDTPVAAVIQTWLDEGVHTVESLLQAGDLSDICAGTFGHQHTGAAPADADGAHPTDGAKAEDLEAVRMWEDEGGSVKPEVPSVRWVLTHLIEEFARHNGHADLLRELIDGSTGE